MIQNNEQRVEAANSRLKQRKAGITLEKDGNSLYLRGMLPPKPECNRQQAFQQRISLKRLGIRLNPAGIAEAEKEANKVSALLARKEFSWDSYLYEQVIKIPTSSECVENLRNYYLNKGGSQETWDGDYWKIFKKLPLNDSLNVEILEKVIVSTQPNSKTRKRACMAIGALVKFMQLDCSFSHLSGNYSPKRVSPRDLPSDSYILDWYYKIANPQWRWVFGMLACYGLRPHEPFRLDFDRLRDGDRVVWVGENTKTGARQVWAFYPEWFEEFKLQNVQLPKVNLNRTNRSLGANCGEFFTKKGLPFPLYNMRHRWAVRTLEFGLDISLAAQQMGHSIGTHSETYHHWITADVHQRAFEKLILRSDRPKAPELEEKKVCLESD
jgi:hypothetical protein